MTERTPDSLRRSTWGLGRTLKTFPEGSAALRRDRILRRLGRIRAGNVTRYGLERAHKWRQLRRTPHPTGTKTPIFVVGCNRSGTNMVCKAIGASPHGWDYPEREFSPAFNGYYLRADWIIDRLIKLTPAPIVAFGSILDSQFTRDLLSRFEGARAVWVYRDYHDVANSCARRQWGPHLRDLVRWVSRGELDRLGARGKHIGPDTVRLFGDLVRSDLSLEEGACLYWYMRNRLYFDLALHTDQRVLIVQYEDAVLNPQRAFEEIFRFLGFPFDPAITADVYASSVGKYGWPGIDPAIEAVCDDLRSRLDAQYVRTRDRRPPP